MPEPTDRQLRQAWKHMTTCQIEALGWETGRDAARVNAARKRILEL